VLWSFSTFHLLFCVSQHTYTLLLSLLFLMWSGGFKTEKKTFFYLNIRPSANLQE
jgi:hypothetical protein